MRFPAVFTSLRAPVPRPCSRRRPLPRRESPLLALVCRFAHVRGRVSRRGSRYSRRGARAPRPPSFRPGWQPTADPMARAGRACAPACALGTVRRMARRSRASVLSSRLACRGPHPRGPLAAAPRDVRLPRRTPQPCAPDTVTKGICGSPASPTRRCGSSLRPAPSAVGRAPRPSLRDATLARFAAERAAALESIAGLREQGVPVPSACGHAQPPPTDAEVAHCPEFLIRACATCQQLLCWQVDEWHTMTRASAPAPSRLRRAPAVVIAYRAWTGRVASRTSASSSKFTRSTLSAASPSSAARTTGGSGGSASAARLPLCKSLSVAKNR